MAESLLEVANIDATTKTVHGESVTKAVRVNTLGELQFFCSFAKDLEPSVRENVEDGTGVFRKSVQSFRCGFRQVNDTELLSFPKDLYRILGPTNVFPCEPKDFRASETGAERKLEN